MTEQQDNTTNATKPRTLPTRKIQLTLVDLEKDIKRLPELTANAMKQSVKSSRYKSVKLSHGALTVIVKALQNYKTGELEKERIQTLELLTKNDDFFMMLFTYNKRKRSK